MKKSYASQRELHKLERKKRKKEKKGKKRKKEKNHLHKKFRNALFTSSSFNYFRFSKIKIILYVIIG